LTTKRKRLDQLIYEQGFTESRTKAQAFILAGKVFVNGERVQKAGTAVDPECSITVHGTETQWVSRGAHKLLKALEVFPFNPLGKVCMDVGASTGGFTEVLLSRGALRVFAVDVGYGQLAWKLRNDPRVIVMERTNARYIAREDLPEIIDLVTIDASFISLKILLKPLSRILDGKGQIMALLKPQFEAGKRRIGKKGVVRSPLIHKEIISEIISFISNETDLKVHAVEHSPIKGPKGNIEFLLYMSLENTIAGYNKELDVDKIVDRAHEELDQKGIE
jgi:23S rRNA (cytidine1920-2'-O)/16S rRNA (cytidine1409-2'-O)-methyltransferase